MRNVSVLRAPWPHGQGFSVGRRHRLGLMAVAAALIVGLVAPAHAANVTVLVSVAYTRAAGAQQVPGALCPVTVAQDADGVVVLNAAKAAGCISSFSTSTFPGIGVFLDCISDVCGIEDPDEVYWYWGIHLNIAPTTYGVDGYRAKDADHLLFLYELFPCAPGIC
jgi:hypothetical protein